MLTHVDAAAASFCPIKGNLKLFDVTYLLRKVGRLNSEELKSNVFANCRGIK